ncbi:MAG: hypothetical protein [Caudoviricetes sp.]|nr:MAG: hypothetical protein [Caudoviricetes sp.]
MSNTETVELCKDIVAAASLLQKFELCEIMESQSRFIEFLNSAGFTTVRGKEFTKMSFRKMWERIDPRLLPDILAEFDTRNFDIMKTMVD